MAPLPGATYSISMDGYDQQGCLHEMFIRQARSTPNNIAIVNINGKKITYAELDRMTDVLATHLRHLGVGRNKIVGILMERCLEYSISYIAIHKAGGAYLPLEVAYPPPLLSSVIEDCEPVAVLTKTTFVDRLRKHFSEDKIICLEGAWIEKSKKFPPITKPVFVELDDLAYTVYSSGTTGKPKGILCPHRGAVFSYHWRHVAYPYEKEEREACNVFFVWEMLRPLLKGKTMFIIPDDVIYDPPRLAEFLRDNKITRMLFTPSLLEALLDYKNIDIEAAFKHMRQIWFCGEVVTTNLRDRFAALCPHVKMLNLYSISETHDVACADLSENYDAKPRKFCPVGKLFPGVHIIIMDENQSIQPVGAPGEIYIGGPTLAIGYLNRPDINAFRFIARPKNLPECVGERLYRTGDWGYMLTDGNLEICGRCDSMVKIRGYSVEIQAVEAALLDLPMVNSGCVLAIGEEGTDKFLAAYIVPEGNTSRKEVRAALKKKFPFYMIPSKFIFLSSIPIVENSGKLDKKALPKIDASSDSGIDPEDLPSTPMEHTLANIWCRLLQLPAIDVQENFFDMGGHSLLATRLLNEINLELGLGLTLHDLFKYPTISSMSSFIENPEINGTDNSALNLVAEVDRYDKGISVMDIRLRAFWRSFQIGNIKSRRDKVFLTGVTGFLGAFLLKELLDNTKNSIYCLVRDAPGVTPLDRIKDTLRKYGILKSGENAKEMEKKLEYRVVAIKGDLTLLNMGMKEDEYMCLSYEIDTIIHAAAHVNLIYPYRALRKANVLGTENVVRFALENKIKPIHHVSTDAVYPMGKTSCSEDDDMLLYANELQDGYGQSKWVSEQLVLRAKERGHPVAVYRCGNIAGSTEDPSWNTADFTLLMIQGSILTSSAPDINWQIELTPVDFVSKVIVTMMQNIMQSIGKTFNIVNTNQMDCQYLWQLLKVQGYSVEVVPYGEWYTKVKMGAQANTENSGILKSLLILLDSYVRTPKFFSNHSTFNHENLDRVLDEMRIKYPAVDTDLMGKYIQYLVRIGYIPKPPKRKCDGPLLLNGKVALVTGASSGIGAAIADQLASAGAKVALAARRTEKLKALQSNIEQHGNVAMVVEMDICDEKQVFSGVKKIESLLGPISILVNNAGVMYYTTMDKMELKQWKQMVDINVTGSLHCLAAALEGMLKRNSGHIITITSDAGRKAFPGLAVYSGTKYFLEATMRATREELSETGIRVTCIQPGDVKTELHGHSKDFETRTKYDLTLNPQVKILQPLDIANAVMYALTQPDYCAVNEILIEPRQAPI